MKNNTLIPLFNRKKNSNGYTLVELLIGAGISVVVIGAAGMGLMNLMRGNKTSTTQAERREEVNRALEFISDEVRRAETIEINPSSNLPASPDFPKPNFLKNFGNKGEVAVLALDVPDNLGQANIGDRIIYYVKPKPKNDKTWLGPNIIYRYGPPLDTNGGKYTNQKWTNQALIDRVSDQTINPPSCSGTPIAAEGFAACVENSKIATVYVNGIFSEISSDKYNADIKVYARAEAEHLDSQNSTVNFGISKASGSSNVKIIGSQMGCSKDASEYTVDANGDFTGGICTIATEFRETDNTSIATVNSGESPVSIGTNSPFRVVVTPSASVTDPFPSYFDSNGDPQPGGQQNNNTAIPVEIDLSKDYLNENPVTLIDDPNTTVDETTLFSPDQVKLLGDKSRLSDLEIGAWNLNGLTDPNKQFKKLKDVLNQEGFLDKDDEITLKSNQYLLVFEVGQKDTTHQGFDLQDQIILITVD